MAGKTIAEKILSARSGADARAGDVVICDFDFALGTDAATPMALDYFDAMGGSRVKSPERFAFSLDHYAPPASAKSAALHDRVRSFARAHGIPLWEVGEGIGLQLMVESGRCRPGGLVIGADSHSTTFGALNTFGTGIGSSDLAAAMISGQVWLRVPETTRVWLDGALPEGVYAKDIILALVGKLGQEGANYEVLEFLGPAAAAMSIEERLVLSNMSVEMGAKAGIFLADERTRVYVGARPSERYEPVSPDPDARYVREITLDVSSLEPQIARPHEPDNVAPLRSAAGTRVDMVFVGTCTGGRVSDFHEVLAEVEAGGGVAPGVMLVLTPASRGVYLELTRDGTLERLTRMGAVITTPGCGACCGTSGVIPGDGMTVVSTANRNFKSRMGNATASIYLASPAACGAAAATGVLSGVRAMSFGAERGRRSFPGSFRAERPGRAAESRNDPDHVPLRRSARNDIVRGLEGRARVLGDDVNTDYIITSARKRETIDANILKRYLLETIDPAFAASVQPGDILVAGRNFGCGSAMEVAVTVPLAAGIRAVIARSFARTYYRNAINNGLLPVECDTAGIREGDRLVIEVGSELTVRNETQQHTIAARPLATHMLQILDAGGLVPYIRAHGGFEVAR